MQIETLWWYLTPNNKMKTLLESVEFEPMTSISEVQCPNQHTWYRSVLCVMIHRLYCMPSAACYFPCWTQAFHYDLKLSVIETDSTTKQSIPGALQSVAISNTARISNFVLKICPSWWRLAFYFIRPCQNLSIKYGEYSIKQSVWTWKEVPSLIRSGTRYIVANQWFRQELQCRFIN